MTNLETPAAHHKPSPPGLLTWNDLADKIAKMNPEQRLEPVAVIDYSQDDETVYFSVDVCDEGGTFGMAHALIAGDEIPTEYN